MALTAPPTSRPSVRPPRVLLVDDDPIVLRAVRRVLLGACPDWEIDLAESVDAALTLLAAQAYDVAVTDLNMPIVDGSSFLARLKAEHPTVMRVIHSSHVEALLPERVQELAHAALTKPGAPEQLVQVLTWAIEQRRKHMQGSVGF